MHKKIVLFKIALITSFLLTTTCMNVVAFGNDGFSGDSCNPDYETHDWIAERALDYPDTREHHINVPFHYQVKKYYCGPAALQMVFDFYGESISQLEIAEVARTAPYVSYTDELRRAAHFSNLSTSMGTEIAENITGYTARKLGYVAFEQGGMTIEDLKSLINQNYPIILLMWFTHEHVYGHYRVAVGCNETHILLHDPWNNEAWGGEYGGPNLPMNYTFFLEMWEYSGHLGLFVSPWKIVLSAPQVIKPGQAFDLKANITYPCLDPFPTYDYPASSCNATLILQEGINLTSGENATKPMGTGEISASSRVEVSWRVQAEHCGTYHVKVLAQGIVEGFVGEKPVAGPSYSYRDRIGGYNETDLLVVTTRIIRVPTDYDTIQGAINVANPGDTIYVYNGTYHEHVVVNKTISLVGEDRSTTIISGGKTGIGIHVTASNVNLSEFTVKQCCYGIILEDSSNCRVNGNTVINSEWGILLFNSGGNTLKDNNMTGNDYNFGVGGRSPSLSEVINDIDTSNTVNSKSVYYLVNQHNLTIYPLTFLDVGYLALINSTNIMVKNLALTHNRQGVLLFYTNSSTIENVCSSDNSRGITLWTSANCTVTRNNVSDNDAGIEILYSSDCVATANTVTNTVTRGEEGFVIYSSENCKIGGNIVNNTWYGVCLCYSNRTDIKGTNITNNHYGITLRYSNNNTITKNNVINNRYGIYFSHISNGNTIYHNNLINNAKQVHSIDSINTWDDGFPFGGNCWSDYNGTDVNQDGIGDTPYVIDGNNRDNYPLMGFFSGFTITWDEEDYPLTTVCNFTISNFRFNASQKMISFNVTGKDGTTGFCRVTIPNILVQGLWEGNCTVLVDGNLSIMQKNWTDETNTYLYFTYTYDTTHVIIVPEFPVAITMPLIMIATLLAAVFRKKISNY